MIFKIFGLFLYYLSASLNWVDSADDEGTRDYSTGHTSDLIGVANGSTQQQIESDFVYATEIARANIESDIEIDYRFACEVATADMDERRARGKRNLTNRTERAENFPEGIRSYILHLSIAFYFRGFRTDTAGFHLCSYFSCRRNAKQTLLGRFLSNQRIYNRRQPDANSQFMRIDTCANFIGRGYG